MCWLLAGWVRHWFDQRGQQRSKYHPLSIQEQKDWNNWATHYSWCSVPCRHQKKVNSVEDIGKTKRGWWRKFRGVWPCKWGIKCSDAKSSKSRVLTRVYSCSINVTYWIKSRYWASSGHNCSPKWNWSLKFSSLVKRRSERNGTRLQRKRNLKY